VRRVSELPYFLSERAAVARLRSRIMDWRERLEARLCEEISLKQAYSLAGQPRIFLFGLDPFGDDVNPEIGTDLADRPNNGLVPVIVPINIFCALIKFILKISNPVSDYNFQEPCQKNFC
jgi:hypothetical protein